MPPLVQPNAKRRGLLAKNETGQAFAACPVFLCPLFRRGHSAYGHAQKQRRLRTGCAKAQAHPLAAVAGPTAGVQFAARGYGNEASVGAGALLVFGKTIDGIDAVGAIGEQLLESFDVLFATS